MHGTSAWNVLVVKKLTACQFGRRALMRRVVISNPDGVPIQAEDGPFILWDMCTTKNSALCEGVNTPRVDVSGTWRSLGQRKLRSAAVLVNITGDTFCVDSLGGLLLSLTDRRIWQSHLSGRITKARCVLGVGEGERAGPVDTLSVIERGELRSLKDVDSSVAASAPLMTAIPLQSSVADHLYPSVCRPHAPRDEGCLLQTEYIQ